MNFLAHIYLSGENEQIRIGNFIGDYVKGKGYENYPEEIRKGILLHREIDSFTDHHPVVYKSKMHLNQRFRKYSGIIVDIFYDHYLAKEWDRFHHTPLQEFVAGFYQNAMAYFAVLPPRVRQFLPFLIINNWFESYLSIEGIESVLYRMSRRTSLPEETKYAIEELVDKYDQFNEEFLEFFPSIIEHVAGKFDIDFSPFRQAS